MNYFLKKRYVVAFRVMPTERRIGKNPTIFSSTPKAIKLALYLNFKDYVMSDQVRCTVPTLTEEADIKNAISLFISLDKDSRNLARRLITVEQFEQYIDYAVELFIERATYNEGEDGE